MNFEFIGLKHTGNLDLYHIFDKDLFKPVLRELRELDTYFNLIYKNTYRFNQNDKILIQEEYLNILIKHNRINKLKILDEL